MIKPISIVIPVWDKLDIRYTELCVKSIRDGSTVPHEIILVVNPAPKEKEEEIRNKYKHIDAMVLLSNEQGQGIANNLGSRNATNQWMAIADNDNVFPKNWEKGLEQLKPDTVVTFNSMEWNERGSAPGFINFNCGNIDTFDMELFNKKAEELSVDKSYPGTTYPFIIEKKHFDTIGGFDEKFDPLGSTTDNFLRYKMMLYGLDLIRYFGITCYHFANMTAWKGEADEICSPLLNRNRRYFEQQCDVASAPSPQVWYSEFFIDETKIRFNADWIGRISRKYIGKESDNQYWQCGGCRYMCFNTREICPICGQHKQ